MMCMSTGSRGTNPFFGLLRKEAKSKKKKKKAPLKYNVHKKYLNYLQHCKSKQKKVNAPFEM